MRWYSLIVLDITIIAAVVSVFITAGQLPDPVATHFGPGNRADAWMTRDGYQLYMIVFLVVFPTLMALLIGLLPQMFPRWTNIPNRDYWLAPERQAESMRFLSAHGCWLGGLIVLVVVGVHYAILEAHWNEPPTLPMSVFLPMMGGFLLGVVVWIGILYRRFRKPAKVPCSGET